ncbi:MAG TPA: hypothetical protein VFC73_08850 [Syntrophomonadaceae bacterium]|nr:hypothetical protein [Syntrophomonadaceae bacterium]
MKCKHDFVRSGHGNDLICTKCGYAAAQATFTAPIIEPMIKPNLRQEVKIPIHNGDKTEIGMIYKDELERKLNKAFMLNALVGEER